MTKGRGKVLSLPVTPVELNVEQAVEAFLKRDLSPNTLQSSDNGTGIRS